MIKYPFCLFLLILFLGTTPLFAARIALKSTTVVAPLPLRVVPEIRPAQHYAFPAFSFLSQPQVSNMTLRHPTPNDRLQAALERAANDKRYSFKERLVLKYLRKHLKKLRVQDGETIDPRKRKQGRLALILGAGAFVVAFIPVLQILSPLMAITAIALGIVSVQGNSNLPGILGICFGGAFLLLVLAAIAILVLAFSFW